jgi:carboxylate-amine ligase
MLYRLRTSNQKWRTYPGFLIEENRWRAQRYGVRDTLFDFGKGKLVPFAALIDELIDLIAEDAAVLGCEREVKHALNIATGGTSADRQVERFASLVAGGASVDDALIGVVDQLIAETVAGT